MSGTTTHPPFPTHAKAVVRAVRGAFAEVVTSAGADAHDPGSISRRIGLNRNLAWKISRIIQDEDPAAALTQMPGSSGLRIFLRGSERAGANAGIVQTAKAAIEDFEELIRVHSGDRATLEMMGSELSEQGNRQRDEQHRKLLFQGGSYVLGVQTRVVLKIGLVMPGAADGLLDFASVNGLVDFRRLRQDVTWVMASRHGRNDDGSEMTTGATEPIDPDFAGADEAPLIGAYCSQPLPELRRVEQPSGVSFELVEGRVGNTGALTCYVGAIQRGIPYYRTDSNEWGEHSAICDVPAEMLLMDLFIHESFAFALDPETFLCSVPGTPYAGGGQPRHRLPFNEKVQQLGPGTQPPATPDVPRYASLLRSVFERTGQDVGAYHGLRIRIAYPAYPATLMLRYPLPEKP